MKARPILMHGRSVQNLLAGRKTQTRRIVKPQPHHFGEHGLCFSRPDYPGVYDCLWGPPLIEKRSPYGQPGDLLYVRETWADEGDWIAYKADRRDEDGCLDPPGIKYRPSIHMPRWASRITLYLSDVRVERVQEISEDDAIAEGCFHGRGGGMADPSQLAECHFPTLWDDTNGRGDWDRNDWVWVLEFDVIHANVDDVLAEREK